MPNAPEDARGARPIIACFTNFKVSSTLWCLILGKFDVFLGSGECFEAVEVSEGVTGDLHH